ncbi:MAG: DUF4423 domain-containing protein [Pseudobacteriovorax sp.]|nr:DUF4423 domain-containing protein [Pseudobacteriovorax sp.]
MQSRLHAQISKKEVEHSLSLLQELKLISFDPDTNQYRKLKEDFSSPVAVPGLGVRQFHMKMIQLSMEALQTVPSDKRDISAVTIATSAEGRESIRKEIENFRRYLLFVASQYPEKEEVLEINFQMFDLTREPKGNAS